MDITLRTESWTVEDRSWLASRDGTEFTFSITLDTSAFTEGTHYPAGFVASGTVLSKLSSGLYGPYAGSSNEVQTVGLGSASAGTVTITFDGETTAAIAYDATASAVSAALLLLDNVNAGDITVTGGPFPGVITLTFGGAYLGQNVPQVLVTPSGLTGGTVTVATTTAGDGGTGGTETASGFLFNSTQMRASGPDVGAPLLWRGAIKESRLPTNHGLDAAARADLAAKFLFR